MRGHHPEILHRIKVPKKEGVSPFITIISVLLLGQIKRSIEAAEIRRRITSNTIKSL